MSTVNVNDLPLQELHRLSQQVDQEVELLTGSITQLKAAQQKFVESNENVKKLTTEVGSEQELLVPMTSSLYVPGRMANANTVLVDVGTGYFIEKTFGEAGKYFEGRIEYLTKQIEKVQPILQDKMRTKQVLTEVLQAKVQQALSTNPELLQKAP